MRDPPQLRVRIGRLLCIATVLLYRRATRDQIRGGQDGSDKSILASHRLNSRTIIHHVFLQTLGGEEHQAYQTMRNDRTIAVSRTSGAGQSIGEGNIFIRDWRRAGSRRNENMSDSADGKTWGELEDGYGSIATMAAKLSTSHPNSFGFATTSV